MDKSEYINLTEAALLLGISRATVQKWIKEGVIRTVKIGREHRIERKYLENLSGWESLADTQKKLDGYIEEIKRQTILHKKQLSELKLLHSNNSEIINLRQMSSIIMVRMWKILSRETDVTEQEVEMITMALGGCSSSFIANKMLMSSTSVQCAIRKGLRKMESFNVQLNHLEKLKNLQEQNERLTHENDVLKQNINSLIKEKIDSTRLVEATPEQYDALMKKITETGLSARVVHAMKRCQVKTVMELARMTNKDLLSIPNLGKKSIIDIKAFLEQNHLTLGMLLVVDPDLKTLKINLNNKANAQ